MGRQLNGNSAELLDAADTYTDLAEHTAQLGPQAAAEAQRIADTHGPMGHPAAIGMAAALAHAGEPLTAKVTDFQAYSRRSAEHAATYIAQDHAAAQTYTAPDTSPFAPIRPAAVTIGRPDAVIVWYVPTPAGFRCTNLFPTAPTSSTHPLPTGQESGCDDH